MLPELKTLYSYKNEAVMRRYTQDFPHATLSAENAFKELMKFMWLSLKARSDRKSFSCAIHQEMTEIDNMWHTFLLFTRDYQTFCNNYLGEFFHHIPLSNQSKLPSDEEYESELTEYLTYICDNLNEKTLKTWFQV